jgi:hypothetical protein
MRLRLARRVLPPASGHVAALVGEEYEKQTAGMVAAGHRAWPPKVESPRRRDTPANDVHRRPALGLAGLHAGAGRQYRALA